MLRATFKTWSNESRVFVMATLLAATCYFTHSWLSSVAPDEPMIPVSGVLALTESLLGEAQAPHPVGSTANKAVKQRITAWLTDHGIAHEVQAAWGCADGWGYCSKVENIIATLPGEMEGPDLALMAHYDSTPPTPGAGDNLVAVATILTTAEKLQSRSHRNPIMLIITDGEERGLTGAEAFFTQHPLRHRVGALINLEGAVGTGPPLLFRASGASKKLIELYGTHAAQPLGSSLYNEVFKHMAANTDFAVPTRFDVPGIDIAKAGDGSWKHTMLDNIDNLHAPTLQLMVDNVFGLASALANTDFDDLEAGQSSFLSVYGVWLQYDAYLNYVWLGLSFLVFAVLSARLGWRATLSVSLVPLAYFFVCFFGLIATYLLLHFANGDTPFHPAYKAPFRMLLFSVPFLIGLIFASRINRDRPPELVLVGTWWFMWYVSVVFVIFLNTASIVVVVPTIIAAALLGAAHFTNTLRATALRLGTLLLVVPVFLNLVLLIEITQGYWFIPATAICFTLFFAAFAVFARGALVPAAKIVTAAVAVFGLGLAIYLPLYTPERPQTMIYRLVQSTDSNEAWLEFVSLNALPDSIERVEPFRDEAQIYPWSDDLESVATQTPLDEPPPTFTVLERHPRKITVQAESARKGLELGFVFPEDSNLIAYSIGGRTYEIEPMRFGSWPGNFVVALMGLYGEQAQITFHTDSSEPLQGWIYDIKRGLPGTYDYLMEARAPLAIEVSGGDRSLFYTRIEL